MPKTKETVNTKDENGNDLVLDVKYPSGKIEQEASVLYTTHWQSLLARKVKPKKKVEELLKEQGIWTDKDEEQRTKLEKEIMELSRKLKLGQMKKSEGRKLAVDILKKRATLRAMLTERNSYDNNSAEALATNVKFDYLVSACTVYNTTGEKYFKDLDDYVARRGEQAAWDAASKMAEMIYPGIDFSADFNDHLIEVQFLKKFNYVDSEGRFINEQGNRVNLANEEVTDDIYKSEDGKLVVEFGEFSD